ncbi:family 16 glycosylhydrolase [uncultured Draconibacterium sp.]|uniref:family 16 glycosylhydrolase n=1 Tax=uncultured Draconibacterium sp. TaxID=1573823 RepID=UPI0025FFEC5A|nr:family 16 glycosylhydrolase [uncultured Draconibacterium sp.]
MKSYLVFVLLVFQLIHSVYTSAQNNLYPDSISGLEIDFWYGSSTQPAESYSVSIANDPVFDGTRSVKFNCPDAAVPTGGHATVVLGGTNPDYQSGNIAVTRGDYVFSAKIFVEGTVPANILFYLTEQSQVITDGINLILPLADVSTGSWQTISIPVAFVEDIPQMKTGIRMRGVDYIGLSGASTVYIDQMALVQEVVEPEDTVYSPILDAGNSWGLNPAYSDEFNSTGIDAEKWNIDVNDWGTWSWEPENATSPDTVLALKMQQKQHTRGGNDYYFTSGIAQIKETITYGYFEARIKASDKGQGTCPAFWLYSVGQPTPTEEGGVQYCEIDAIEIFQIPNQLKTLEMNLHTRIIENGELTWKRPGQGDTELTHNSWDAPWDPRDEYHTYAVWNRLDSIFWYVDGIQRGAKKNYYWHLPMHLTVSMGLRTPYEKYIDGVRTVMPYPESNPEPGFPTEMYCDYVRAYNTSPQLFAEVDDYKNKEFLNRNSLEFECRYFAGNGETVLDETDLNGLTCLVQELDENGAVVTEIMAADATTIGNESGKAKLSIDISSLNPSSALDEGHYYVLKPVFKSSFNEGTEVVLAQETIPVQITGNLVSVSELNQAPDVKVYPNPALNQVSISSADATEILIYNVLGVLIKQEAKLFEPHVVDLADVAEGIYVVSVKSGKGTVNRKLQVID